MENLRNRALKKTLGNSKILLFGLPGAYTSTCSKFHLPGYVKNVEKLKAKGINRIFCISVNDPHVMNAWGEANNVGNNIVMLADPSIYHLQNQLVQKLIEILKGWELDQVVTQ